MSDACAHGVVERQAGGRASVLRGLSVAVQVRLVSVRGASVMRSLSSFQQSLMLYLEGVRWGNGCGRVSGGGRVVGLSWCFVVRLISSVGRGGKG